MTKTPAWQTQSIKRWKYILADAKKGGVKTDLGGKPTDETYGFCGHCGNFYTSKNNCSNCPLFTRKVCYNRNPMNSTYLFWRISSALQKSEGKTNKRIVSMIEKMLEEVKQ